MSLSHADKFERRKILLGHNDVAFLDSVLTSGVVVKRGSTVYVEGIIKSVY